MTDAPKRIWVNPRTDTFNVQGPLRVQPGEVEYVRADLYAALEQAQEKSRAISLGEAAMILHGETCQYYTEVQQLREAIRETPEEESALDVALMALKGRVAEDTIRRRRERLRALADPEGGSR